MDPFPAPVCAFVPVRVPVLAPFAVPIDAKFGRKGRPCLRCLARTASEDSDVGAGRGGAEQSGGVRWSR